MMSEEDWQRYNCERKKPYHMKAAERVAKKERWPGTHAYRCTRCQMWHVGRPPKKKVEIA